MSRKLGFIALFLMVFWVVGGTARADESRTDRRVWKRVPVPGTHCGDGEQYSVFLSEGDPEKVALAFMGGGACWSEATCLGSDRKTLLSLVPFVTLAGGFSSANPAVSAVAGWTMVFFPYCTGDVFAADHIAQYGSEKVYHTGRSNVERTLEFLKSRALVDFKQASDLAVWGPSAGALGALFHAQLIDGYFPRAERRALIADAPGLHFGPTFWDKFTPALLEEFSAGLARAGVRLEKGRGLDAIMSSRFGEISPEEHERQVRSPQGVLALTADPADLCRAWVPDSSLHTFLPTGLFLEVKAGGVTARDFLREIVERKRGKNLVD
jgi:hypothetical protein